MRLLHDDELRGGPIHEVHESASDRGLTALVVEGEALELLLPRE